MENAVDCDMCPSFVVMCYSKVLQEEVGFHHNLSEVERIQELETRVSDQMIALQKLTLENKQLRSSSK